MDPTSFPTDGVELTQLLVVSDIERSKRFYRDVLGASVYREYGGTSCVLDFQGNWLLLVTGGEALRLAAREIIETLSGGPFIFNLGHGILPQTPPEHVAELLETIRR